MAFHPPAFIAFTGVDRVELKPGMVTLSSRYPIEWGMLIDEDKQNVALFPAASVRAELLSGVPLRWAAHVCGAEAVRIVRGAASAPLTFAGFQRVQLNHSFSGSAGSDILNGSAFGRRHGIRPVLQCQREFPVDLRVDWLFDVSFGKGAAPSAWPSLPTPGPFCGYSGGLNADTIRQVLHEIAAPGGVPYWIDMESGVRTEGWFDLAKCEAVCRAVYE